MSRHFAWTRFDFELIFIFERANKKLPFLRLLGHCSRFSESVQIPSAALASMTPMVVKKPWPHDKKQGPSNTPVRSSVFFRTIFRLASLPRQMESFMHATQKEEEEEDEEEEEEEMCCRRCQELAGDIARSWRWWSERRVVADLEVALRAATARRLGF